MLIVELHDIDNIIIAVELLYIAIQDIKGLFFTAVLDLKRLKVCKYFYILFYYP